ncbi:TIGR04150 pseudo-rSAM protein [Parabacteroides sp. GYB001]|uniref:TIGR04150 pseudo-rSAM protein n=1 Tax=Parabacteroides leei TaxID=2939491 RepID=UPI002017E560|nr:TIGR04150 pseudo-rSAM protein [Parabacteroides leei]MCL3853736.1 TIGR04150 pseudo-rSAM protein [Parabacteroides leei]
MNTHWFTLHEDTFLWLKGNMGLVYNAENKNRLLFNLSDKIEKICHQLQEIENLYTVELTDDEISDNEINEWVHSLVNIQAGYLSLNVEFDKRPVSLMPILKVQDNREYYEGQQELGFRGKILQNLHELTFYINGSEQGDAEYFKQTIFPVGSNLVLEREKIRSFIKNSRSFFLSNINLVGDFFSYSDFEGLINDISELSIQLTIHISIMDFLDHVQKIKEMNWPTDTRINILVDTIFDISFLKDFPLPFSLTVFVFSDDDFLRYSSMFDTFSSARDIYFIPIYNKENLSFFESNVFIEKEDMDNIDLSKNEIFIRQAINTGDFGKLTIMPDGKVYANVNMPSLGTIDDSPYSIVYKEFTSGESWFKLRTQATCENCVYQWLCPSPSNYEIALDRPNLCHVKN